MPEPPLDAPPPSGDAALDTAADALAWHILGRLPAARSHSREAIEALPSPVARLLLAKLDDRVDREAQPPASDWLDPDGVEDGARVWREAARAAARVPATEWAGFLGEGCRLVVSHLVRPAETLAAYAFSGATTDEIPTALALGRLRAFDTYPYLPEIAGRYVLRKEVARIDRPELERLLRRIDRRMVVGFGVNDWSTLLEPIVSLLGPVSPAGGVPAALLAPFFEAKGRDDLASSFTGDWVYGTDTLYQVLTHVIGTDADVQDAAPPPSSPEPKAEPPELLSEERSPDRELGGPDGQGSPDPSARLGTEAPTPRLDSARLDETPEVAREDVSDVDAAEDRPRLGEADRGDSRTDEPSHTEAPADDAAPDEIQHDGPEERVEHEEAPLSPPSPTEARTDDGSDDLASRPVAGDDAELHQVEPDEGALAGTAAVSGWLAEMAQAPAEAPEPSATPEPVEPESAEPELAPEPVEPEPPETEPEPPVVARREPPVQVAAGTTSSPALRAPWVDIGPRFDPSIYGPYRPTPPAPAVAPLAPLSSPTEDSQSRSEPTAPPPPAKATEPQPDPAEPLWKRAMSRATRPAEAPGAPSEAPASEPLWKRFVSGARPASPEADVPVPPVAPPRPRLPETDGRDDETSLSTDLDRIENRALVGTTDVARREWFVAELFSGSEEEYRKALVDLAMAPTWTVAAEVLGSAFRTHRVNVYSEPALAITDAAEARFRR